MDWECGGKVERQTGANTEIAGNVPADLRMVRAATEARVICRINSYGPTTPGEIEEAIDAGADEILLPMVRSPEEVQMVFEQVDRRCGVDILIETAEAVSKAEEFSILPLSRIYVGLNDLAIERRQPNIFSSLTDGTVERIRRPFRIPFGFGGLTLPECGHPIPCMLLIGEMARMDCSFSFLGRSFHRDITGRDMVVEVPRILAAVPQARSRLPREVARDRGELEKAVLGLMVRIPVKRGYWPMDRLEGQRILITGTTGFIQANLAGTLVHSGADVHALVRPGT